MRKMDGFVLSFLLALIFQFVQCQVGRVYQHQIRNKRQFTLSFGACRFVFNPQCPDPDVTFFMYSTKHPEQPEQIFAAPHLRETNLEKTSFSPKKSSKIIIHGYNSNMFLSALTALRKEYLKTRDYNIFAVDWSPLNRSPCYPAAVWNARHVGTCTAQLVDRIKDLGAKDIHVIGFSLGAQITNYLSLTLRPYLLPRITGLDPALPGYIFAGIDDRLDASDAEFVDVYHTAAFVQGKARESGHVDFYFNGGSKQPGCWGTANFFSCNHQRAPLYYAESINSFAGFWGWQCTNFCEYLKGRCPPNEIQVLIGEKISKYITGTYMVITGAAPPFAIGPYNVTTDELLKPAEYLDKAPSPLLLAFAIPNVPGLEKFTHTKLIKPTNMDESELFEEVLKEQFPNNTAAVQAQIIGNGFGIIDNADMSENDIN